MHPIRFPSCQRFTFRALLVLGLGIIAGCSSPPEPLTEESLRNAEYQGIYAEAVQLTDGRYEGEPFVEGGASRPMVIFIEPHVFGDLDGDSVDDAAVLLVENSGGSGSFVYLAVVLNHDGDPVNQATTLLGDRVQVEELNIELGEIQVRMLTHGPDDPLCCPTLETTASYNLESLESMQPNE